MFVGREEELERLESLYDKNIQSVAVVYGRRRVGKTVLLRKFAESKKTLWFTAFEGNANMLFANLSDIAGKFLYPDVNGIHFDNLLSLLEAIFRKSMDERFVFVIDEYPYIAKAFPEISSLLQRLIDEYKDRGKMLLILSGSSMHFMLHQILGQESPLYGRRDCSILVKPFGIRETALLIGSNRTSEDVFQFWAITGGVPMYLSILDKWTTLREAIIEEFFKDNGYFTNEVLNIFLMEFRSPENYLEVCSLLATGTNKVSVISDKAGMTTSLVSSMLSSLQSLDIVEQEYSLLSSTRKPIWKIKDPLLSFWFRFCYPTNVNTIEGKTVNFDSNFNSFLGHRFEDLCRSMVKYFYDDTVILSIGRWWGGNPITHIEEELDIIARTNDGLIIGECKYKNSPVDSSVLNLMEDRASLLGTDSTKKRFIIFSKTCFTKTLQESSTLKLVDFDMLYSKCLNQEDD